MFDNALLSAARASKQKAVLQTRAKCAGWKVSSEICQAVVSLIYFQLRPSIHVLPSMF
jgi:hypothetical protein